MTGRGADGKGKAILLMARELEISDSRDWRTAGKYVGCWACWRLREKGIGRWHGRFSPHPNPRSATRSGRSPTPRTRTLERRQVRATQAFHRPSHARLAPRPGPGFLPLDHGCRRANSSSERPPEKAAGLGQTTAQACATGLGIGRCLGVFGVGTGVAARALPCEKSRSLSPTFSPGQPLGSYGFEDHPVSGTAGGRHRKPRSQWSDRSAQTQWLQGDSDSSESSASVNSSNPTTSTSTRI